MSTNPVVKVLSIITYISIILHVFVTLYLTIDSKLKIAEFLEQKSVINKVYYPGLKNHEGYEVAKKQMNGFGGIVTCVLSGGLEKARRFLETCQIFQLAESLGGVESLIEHPAIMTHAAVPQEVRRDLGIEDGLIRLSVGVEHIDDLINDLERAILAVKDI